MRPCPFLLFLSVSTGGTRGAAGAMMPVNVPSVATRQSMIAIRAPEYCPRLEYAALMMAVDRFVLADTFQYSRQSFQNRTKVRNPQGWQWVSVPLKGRQQGRPIYDVEIRQVAGWRKKHWKAFAFNYAATPFFAYYEAAFAPLFRTPWTNLADLTCATVLLLHDLLGAPTTMMRASALDVPASDLRGLYDQVEGKTLLVPAASAAYDAQAAVPLKVLRYEHPVYRQPFEGFEPGMNTFDLLFSYGPEAASILKAGLRVEGYGTSRDLVE